MEILTRRFAIAQWQKQLEQSLLRLARKVASVRIQTLAVAVAVVNDG